MSDLQVVIDERARLVTAVLAASDWPEQEQAVARHAVHPHSKQIRLHVGPFRAHTAVTRLNQALADGVPLADLFAAALRCTWPDLTPAEPLPATFPAADWLAALAAFERETAVSDFWAAHAQPWEEARSDLESIFGQSRIMPFLGQLLGQPLPKAVAVMPTITYPMLAPVLAETAVTLFFMLPPAKAWGESPPWPHGEDPGWAVSQTCWHLAAYFLKDSLAQLDQTGQALLLHAAVTLCLEQDFDEAEAMAYLVRSKKEHNLPRLPLVVEQVREYLAAGDGRSVASVISGP